MGRRCDRGRAPARPSVSSTRSAAMRRTASAAWRPGHACPRRIGPSPAPSSRRSGPRTRTARRVRSCTSWMPRAASLADEVVVVGFAADDGAEAGDAGVASRLGRVGGRERQLEGARHVEHVEPAEHRPRRRPPGPRSRAGRPAPRRSGRRRSRSDRSSRRRTVRAAGSLRGGRLAGAHAAIVLTLGMQQLLVEVEPLVVQRVTHAAPASRAGRPRCGGWERARSGSGR